MSKKAVFILVILIIAVLAAGGWVYYYIFGGKGAKKPSGKERSIYIDISGVGEGTENPLKNMPSANPLEEVANPFRDAYKNPFK